eukprot:4929603-Pyramimonas_sp.AAC.1
MLAQVRPCLWAAFLTQALHAPLNAPSSVFCIRVILSGAGSSLVTSASSMGLKCMGGPPMESSGRAGGIAAVRASRHRPWALRRGLGELRGGVAERSLVLSSSTVGGRRPALSPDCLSVLPSLTARKLQ